MDVVSGPFWYEGPDFKKRHEIYPANASFKRKKADGMEQTIPGFEGALGVNNAYSDCFLTFTYDFNGDGWTDVLVYGFPGKEVPLVRKPERPPGSLAAPRHLRRARQRVARLHGHHRRRQARDPLLLQRLHRLRRGRLEQPGRALEIPRRLAQGRLPAVHATASAAATSTATAALTSSTRTPGGNSPPRWPTIRFGPSTRFTFAPAAAQLLVYDINGDGLNDVITCINAHGYGISWYEQVRENGNITFREHVILNKDASKNRYGVQFSQPHAFALVDMDGDGLKDFVTGKRFWAHGKDGPDPESNAAAVLYWFRLTRPAKGQAEFVPYLIDDDSGVGTQVTVGTVSNPKYPDVVVGNKKGVFVFKHEVKEVTARRMGEGAAETAADTK